MSGQRPEDNYAIETQAFSWSEVLEDHLYRFVYSPNLVNRKLNDPHQPIAEEELEYLVRNVLIQIGSFRSYGVHKQDAELALRLIAIEKSFVHIVEHAKGMALSNSLMISAAFEEEGDRDSLPESVYRRLLTELSDKPVTSDDPLQHGRRLIDAEDPDEETPLSKAITWQLSARSVGFLLRYEVDVLTTHPFSLLAATIASRFAPEALREEIQRIAIHIPSFIAAWTQLTQCASGSCLSPSEILEMVRQQQREVDCNLADILHSEMLSDLRQLSGIMDLLSESRAVHRAHQILKVSGRDCLAELELAMSGTQRQLDAWYKAGPRAMGEFLVEHGDDAHLSIIGSSGFADIKSRAQALHEMVGELCVAFNDFHARVQNFHRLRMPSAVRDFRRNLPVPIVSAGLIAVI